MDRDLAVALGVLVLVLWTWGYSLFALHWFVRPALRSGVLQARGRTYDRTEKPVMFWLGIAFWIVMSVLLAYPAGLVILQFGRKILG